MTQDPVGLALASIGAAASTGASVVTGGLIIFRSASTATGEPDVAGPSLILSFMVFVGMVTAAGSGWLLARALGHLYQRGVIAALGVFGTLLLAGLTVPVDILGRSAGLVVYLIMLIATAFYTVRKARAATLA